MAADIASLLGKGIGQLRDGQTLEAYMAQLDTSALSSGDGDELRALLELSATLLELGRLPTPAPAAKAANRARFLSAAAQQREQSRSQLASGWLGLFSGLWRGLVRVALSLAMLLLVGVGAVSASVDSLPGSPLYRVKLVAEDVRLALALDHPTRAELYTRFASERGGEILRLANVGHSADEAVLARMAQQWQAAVRFAESASSQAGSRVLVDVLQASKEQTEYLRQASAGAIPETQASLEAGAAIAEQASRAAEEALQGMETPAPTPTSEATGAPVVVPVATATCTATPSAPVRHATPVATEVTGTPEPTLGPSESPMPTATPSRSAAPGPVATQTPPSTSAPTATESGVPPTATATALPSETPEAAFRVTLQDTPDPVPATYRIHYVVCVLNEGDVALTNVVIVDRWSPRDCVYFLPGNPGQLTWSIGTVEPHSQGCRAFDLNTYSVCGGRTVSNAAVMTCDQGTAGAVEYTQISGTPEPAVTATEVTTLTPTLTVTPTATLTATLIPSSTSTPTGTLTATLFPTSELTPTDTLTATLTLTSTLTIAPTLAPADIPPDSRWSAGSRLD